MNHSIRSRRYLAVIVTAALIWLIASYFLGSAAGLLVWGALLVVFFGSGIHKWIRPPANVRQIIVSGTSSTAKTADMQSSSEWIEQEPEYLTLVDDGNDIPIRIALWQRGTSNEWRAVAEREGKEAISIVRDTRQEAIDHLHVEDLAFGASGAVYKSH